MSSENVVLVVLLQIGAKDLTVVPEGSLINLVTHFVTLSQIFKVYIYAMYTAYQYRRVNSKCPT